MRRRISFGLIVMAGVCSFWHADCLAQDFSESGMEVVISRNVELMGILINLTDYWDKQPCEIQPGIETRTRFLPFADHPAVEATQALLDRGWRRVDFYYLGIFFSDFPEARPLVDSADPKMARFVTPHVEHYAEAVRDFYIQSDFGSFWEEKREYYDSIRSMIQTRIGRARIAYFLELVYGTAMDRYYVMPSLQMPCAGLRLERIMDGKLEAFCVFGPCPSATEEDYFIAKQKLIADIIFHQFSYSFLEPLLAEHDTLVTKYSHVYNIVKTGMAEKGHDTWQGVFRENLTCAMQARLAGKIYGRTYYLNMLERAAQSGYVMAPTIADIVDTYCMNRDKYPIFEDYLPQLLATLSERYADSSKVGDDKR